MHEMRAIVLGEKQTHRWGRHGWKIKRGCLTAITDHFSQYSFWISCLGHLSLDSTLALIIAFAPCLDNREGDVLHDQTQCLLGEKKLTQGAKQEWATGQNLLAPTSGFNSHKRVCPERNTADYLLSQDVPFNTGKNRTNWAKVFFKQSFSRIHIIKDIGRGSGFLECHWWLI